MAEWTEFSPLTPEGSSYTRLTLTQDVDNSCPPAAVALFAFLHSMYDMHFVNGLILPVNLYTELCIRRWYEVIKYMCGLIYARRNIQMFNFSKNILCLAIRLIPE